MQNGKYSASREKLRKALADLANSAKLGDPDSLKRAQEFLDKHGRLRSGINQPESVLVVALLFQKIWAAPEVETVNTFLSSIFAPIPTDAFYGVGPLGAITTNFVDGTWEASPRDLLDGLAIELMTSRRMLHRCERPQCQRYFIKDFSRDRYCSIACGTTMRQKGQEEWARKHREELKQRRQKSQSQRRKHAKRDDRKN